MTISITQLGVVFPGGVGHQALLEVLGQGRCLLRPSGLDPELFAARIEADLKALVARRGLTSLSRSALLAAGAIEDLVRSVPSLLPEKSPGECALVVGTAFGHVESKAQFHRVAREEGVRLVSPILFPNTIINSLAGHAAILFGLEGPNSTVASGRRSGLEAVVRAEGLLRASRAARAIAVGSEEVSQALLRALSTARARPVCPGEAAVAFLLETGRQSRSLATIQGSGEATTVGRGPYQAVIEAMQSALAEAGISRREVTFATLSAGGGLPDVDRAEVRAVRELLGEEMPCFAPKAIFGETYGAGGALALAAASLAAGAGLFPPTPGDSPILRELVALGATRTSPLRLRAEGSRVIVNAVDEEGATSIVVAPTLP